MSTIVQHITTRDVEMFMEKWAPAATKMDFDNTGLLTGDPEQPVQRILTCLDVTPAVIDEAIKEDVQLIVAHHPIIFPKLTRVVENDPTGAMLRQLIRHDIGVYAAHTNLDAAANGVSQSLARRLELQDIHGLSYSYDTTKLAVIRLPAAMKQSIERVLADFQLYCHWASEEQNVAAGRFICDKYQLPEIEKAIHQYIDGAPVSIDRIPVETPSPQYAFGALGTLPAPMPAQTFLGHIQKKLDAFGIRYAGGTAEQNISKVAVCGGSGAFLIQAARKAGADAFVTADIKYHDFFTPSSFLLVDTGHYESEAPAIDLLTQELQQAFSGLKVRSTQINTNPMRAFNLFNS